MCELFNARHIMQLSNGFPWKNVSEIRFSDPTSNQRVFHSTHGVGKHETQTISDHLIRLPMVSVSEEMMHKVPTL